MATAELVTTSPTLPEPITRRGVNEAQWRTLCNNVFPGADPQSVLMVVDYCAARKLDPLKKPCHIVPMKVKDAKSGEWNWRDVVMPGIYEYRITAHRTGQYLGRTEFEYGDEITYIPEGAPKDYAGIKTFAWAKTTVKRKTAHGIAEFPVRRYFAEVVGVASKTNTVNDRWTKAPVQMLEKCVEAAALREAFPEEFGGEHTAEEIEGQPPIDTEVRQEPPKPAQRISQQTTTTTTGGNVSVTVAQEPEPTSSDAPAVQASAQNIGVIVDVRDKGNGAAAIVLDTGFAASTKDAATIQSAARLRDEKRRVELVTTPSSDPTKYAPKLTELMPLPVDEAQA